MEILHYNHNFNELHEERKLVKGKKKGNLFLLQLKI